MTYYRAQFEEKVSFPKEEKPEEAEPKTRKPLPKVSPEKAAFLRKYRKIKAQIEQERYPRCEGCGAEGVPLDPSHLASQKHYPWLALEKENIRLHCRTCHNKWEGNIPGREQMKDYHVNLAYLLNYAPEAYRKLELKSINPQP